ncbi:LysR family transcriptional regulator [Ruania rhizosphaerae]|uniref:LysR family transcriptional regulator n=1 Tax=Ruania rhizosphaerae TaxID=1840413 RepID=UPI001357FD1A|nr:LysR family transcriptional regulator [Ruania rhizosphaerae]
MEIRWLETFVAVVENGGFAKAADVLYCSQPTVSAQVSALERELGAELLDRGRRPVELTESGRALLHHARAVLDQIESARGSVSDVLGARRGTVRLGTYPSATAGYIPSLLERFHQNHPLVRVHLVELGGAYLEQAALSGEVNLFLRQTTPPLSSSQFFSEPLWQERLKVIADSSHHLGAVDVVPPQALLGQPLIMTGHYRLDSLLSHPLWRDLGEPPTLAYEVSHPQSLIELVRAGLGIGITTALALHVSRVGNLAVKDIDHPGAVRDVSVYWPSGRRLSAATQALLDFMTTTAPVPPVTESIRTVGTRTSGEGG